MAMVDTWSFIDFEKIFEVRAKTLICESYGWEREYPCKLLGFTHRKSVNPHHCPSRVVHSVLQPRVQPPSGIKTRLERGDNRVIRGVDVDSVVEPSNLAGESDSGVECLWVCDVSEDPRHTPCVIGVCLTDNGEILWLQPWFRLLNLYASKRDRRRWRLAAKERPDSPVPHLMDP